MMLAGAGAADLRRFGAGPDGADAPELQLPREVILDQRSMGTYLLHSGKIALWRCSRF
jgi:flagellar biosynthetic protein FlhB